MQATQGNQAVIIKIIKIIVSNTPHIVDRKYSTNAIQTRYKYDTAQRIFNKCCTTSCQRMFYNYGTTVKEYSTNTAQLSENFLG